jgi:hypothetical protein
MSEYFTGINNGYISSAFGRLSIPSGPSGPSGPAGPAGPAGGPSGPSGPRGPSGPIETHSSGIGNTKVGENALMSNTGINNTAIGYHALENNTTGNNNTAIGFESLTTNSTGSDNTAIGYHALAANSTGEGNIAIGPDTLIGNTTGNFNTAIGMSALVNNQNGTSNTSIGFQALYYNVSGANNTCIGRDSLSKNTGRNNTAIGNQALKNNTTGSGNIGIGFMTPNGSYAPVSDPTTLSNILVLGHTSITNAYVQVPWTWPSDERDKTNIGQVPLGLEFIDNLNPVSYQFRESREVDTPNGGVRYGFLAQDILALEGDNPVIIDNKDPNKLKYVSDYMIAVLVNAVKELSSQVAELKTELTSLKGNNGLTNLE